MVVSQPDTKEQRIILPRKTGALFKKKRNKVNIKKIRRLCPKADKKEIFPAGKRAGVNK